MNWLKRLILLLCMVTALAVVNGCGDNEGPGEKLGKQFDQAVDHAKDKMDELGDQAKDTYDDMKDKAKDAMDN
ncbi:YtxH domain-containing protein [Maridesulfovibrio sp.]|uniref:YtxH domain-containing protein n=1 Tax=Maridesulfovibrio sp. TaxID=2795000 RepID=UPI002A18E752|nr:YtxH domain-containing protein [Maridesulfovibrio sp.]